MVSADILERRDRIAATPILERIAGLKDDLTAAGNEAQELRHLPGWASAKLAEQGLYRFALPRELGGEALSAREQIEVVEAVSAIDGSVGWCVQISSEINALVIRQMDDDLAQRLFNEWTTVVCSGHGPANGPNPGREARRDGDGWRLNYQGSFASNCHNANWNYLMGAMTVDPATGEPAQASYMIPKGEFDIIETWDTAGMRGSGSQDVRMSDCYVPPKHLLLAARTFVLDTQDRLEAHLGPLPNDGGRIEPEWEYFWPALLACAHAAQSCREIVGMINNTAGTTGSRMDSPLERQLRDAHQAANHALISYRHYEDLGRTFVGHEPPAGYMELSRA